MSATPLTIPAINSSGWGTPLNFDLALLNAILTGTIPIAALLISGNLTVDGTINAGNFAGLNGAFFLQSSLFNQPNGVPQLNAAGLIPASLIAGNGIVTVAYSETPSFNAANGNGFDITLTGNVAASTFINGTSGGTLVAFRITQDSVGGRTFVWPTNTRNMGTINLGAGWISTQLAMLQTDGSLDAVAPMLYSAPPA